MLTPLSSLSMLLLSPKLEGIPAPRLDGANGVGGLGLLLGRTGKVVVAVDCLPGGEGLLPAPIGDGGTCER